MPGPWSVADAPPEFIDGLVAGIVGLELTITHLTGKWKLSRTSPPPTTRGHRRPPPDGPISLPRRRRRDGPAGLISGR